jgi:3-oxoacyl-[acyl-carrier protein] reductase
VNVTIAARAQAGIDAAVEKLKTLGDGNIQGVSADVTTDEGRRALIEACPEADILVNNAGGPPPGDFRTWSRDDWIAALDANMLSAIELIKAVIGPMENKQFGRIINITSHMVKEPMGMLGLSNGARAGLTGFIGGLARDVARDGITVNNILPGQFDTDRLKSNHEKFAARSGSEAGAFRERMMKQVPARRFGTPEEFGATCAFLCSQHGGFITGQNILLDGGQYRGLM